MRSLPPTSIPSQQRLHLTQDGSWKRCRAKSEATCGVKSKQHRVEPADSVVATATQQAEREGQVKMAELEATFSCEQVFDAKYEHSLDFIAGRFNRGADFATRSNEEDAVEIFRAEFPALIAQGKVTEEAVESFRIKLYNLTLTIAPEELEYYNEDRARVEVRKILEGALEIEQGVDGSYRPGERAYAVALNLPDRAPSPFDFYKNFDWKTWAESLEAE